LQHASPTARNFPSGLKLTQVAAFIFSLAVHALVDGESTKSLAAGEACGEGPAVASRRAAAARLRLSFCVGVEGPPYIEADEFMGLVVGRAR
jgi:hypothetical protein